MDIKEAAHPDVAQQPDVDRVFTPRRWLLAAGLGGAAASLLATRSGRARAQARTTPDTGPTDETNPTTTLPPPKRPTAADVDLLGFAQSIELAIRDLYDTAINGGVFDDETVAANITTIREAHSAYGQSISGLLARQAPNQANQTLYNELESSFTGTQSEVLAAALSVENRAVVSHLELVGLLEGIDGSALIASILMVEARQAVVLTTMLGNTDVESLLTAGGNPFLPADYPIVVVQ